MDDAWFCTSVFARRLLLLRWQRASYTLGHVSCVMSDVSERRDEGVIEGDALGVQIMMASN